MKRLLLIISLSFLLFCSCRQNGFTQRKYTGGVYFSSRKEASAPVARDHSKTVTASAKEIPVKISEPVLLGPVLDARQQAKTQNITATKKDTIFIIKKCGRNRRIVKRDSVPIVVVVPKEKYGPIDTRAIRLYDKEKYKDDMLLRLKTGAIASNVLFWLPVGGLIIACKTRQQYRLVRSLCPEEDLRTQNALSAIGLGLSILFFVIYAAVLLAVIGAFIYLVLTLPPFCLTF